MMIKTQSTVPRRTFLRTLLATCLLGTSLLLGIRPANAAHWEIVIYGQGVNKHDSSDPMVTPSPKDWLPSVTGTSGATYTEGWNYKNSYDPPTEAGANALHLSTHGKVRAVLTWKSDAPTDVQPSSIVIEEQLLAYASPTTPRYRAEDGSYVSFNLKVCNNRPGAPVIEYQGNGAGSQVFKATDDETFTSTVPVPSNGIVILPEYCLKSSVSPPTNYFEEDLGDYYPVVKVEYKT